MLNLEGRGGVLEVGPKSHQPSHSVQDHSYIQVEGVHEGCLSWSKGGRSHRMYGDLREIGGGGENLDHRPRKKSYLKAVRHRCVGYALVSSLHLHA